MCFVCFCSLFWIRENPPVENLMQSIGRWLDSALRLVSFALLKSLYGPNIFSGIHSARPRELCGFFRIVLEFDCLTLFGRLTEGRTVWRSAKSSSVHRWIQEEKLKIPFLEESSKMITGINRVGWTDPWVAVIIVMRSPVCLAAEIISKIFRTRSLP